MPNLGRKPAPKDLAQAVQVDFMADFRELLYQYGAELDVGFAPNESKVMAVIAITHHPMGYIEFELPNYVEGEEP